METVLITGGAGFIGSNTARYLRRLGHDVFVIDDLSLGRPENLPLEVPLLVGDVAKASVWRRAPVADVIVHLAGASSAPMFRHNLSSCMENNVLGCIRMLEYAHACGARRVIYASTSSVYGNVEPPIQEDGPIDLPNFYAVSKFCMEQVARMYHLQHHLDVVGLRFMSVYGPCEEHKSNFANLVSQFIWAIEAGQAPVVYGDGNQTRDFTNVRDIAQAIRRIIEHRFPLSCQVFNVGTGQPTSVNSLIGILSELLERPVQPEYIPNPVQVGYVRQQICNMDRIRRTVGYRPAVALRDGICELIQLRRNAGQAVENPAVCL